MLIGLLKTSIKLENIMGFYFKDTRKDIIMTEEDEEDYRKK